MQGSPASWAPVDKLTPGCSGGGILITCTAQHKRHARAASSLVLLLQGSSAHLGLQWSHLHHALLAAHLLQHVIFHAPPAAPAQRELSAHGATSHSVASFTHRLGAGLGRVSVTMAVNRYTAQQAERQQLTN